MLSTYTNSEESQEHTQQTADHQSDEQHRELDHYTPSRPFSPSPLNDNFKLDEAEEPFSISTSSLHVLARAAADSQSKKRKLEEEERGANNLYHHHQQNLYHESRRSSHHETTHHYTLGQEAYLQNAPANNIQAMYNHHGITGDEDVQTRHNIMHVLQEAQLQSDTLTTQLNHLHAAHTAQSLQIQHLEATNTDLRRENCRLLQLLVQNHDTPDAAGTSNDGSTSRKTTTKKTSPSQRRRQEISTPKYSAAQQAEMSSAVHPPPPSLLTTASWNGIPVYQLHHFRAKTTIMRRQSDNWINATHILKTGQIARATRLRILEKEVHTGVHEKVQGGYGKYQGTWVPLEVARELASKHNLLTDLAPIFTLEQPELSVLAAAAAAAAAATSCQKAVVSGVAAEEIDGDESGEDP